MSTFAYAGPTTVKVTRISDEPIVSAGVVPGYGPIFNRGRTLADRHRVNDSAVIFCLLRVMAGTPHDSGAPQMLQQLFLQGATGLNEQAAIDGLV